MIEKIPPATHRTDALMDATSPIGFKGQEMVDLARDLETALNKAAYALFQVKRFVDAGPATRDFVRDAYDEAMKVLEKE